jgi:hypothetical protein
LYVVLTKYIVSTNDDSGNKKTFPSHTGTKRSGYALFVVPPTFRVFENAKQTLRRREYALSGKLKSKRAHMTVNGAKSYTLLALCRLARGIRSLLAGALAAGGASSLLAPGKRHVSRWCRESSIQFCSRPIYRGELLRNKYTIPVNAALWLPARYAMIVPDVDET